jgi:hypothetical protein
MLTRSTSMISLPRLPEFGMLALRMSMAPSLRK